MYVRNVQRARPEIKQKKTFKQNHDKTERGALQIREKDERKWMEYNKMEEEKINKKSQPDFGNGLDENYMLFDVYNYIINALFLIRSFMFKFHTNAFCSLHFQSR